MWIERFEQYRAEQNEKHNSAICVGTNNATGRLKHTTETWKCIGIVEAGACLLLKEIPNEVALGTDLRKPDPNDNRANQIQPIRGRKSTNGVSAASVLIGLSAASKFR